MKMLLFERKMKNARGEIELVQPVAVDDLILAIRAISVSFIYGLYKRMSH